MAENENTSQSTIDALRAELGSLRAQLEDMLKNADQKGRDVTAEMARKIAHEIEHCRHKAALHAEHLRDAGKEGLGEVEAHVRQNPLASLAIAFGIGCLVSCLFRRLR